MLDKQKAAFSDPPNEYRFAPFWFWNHKLDHDEILWQIQQMHEKGLGGFIMHARRGLITPYMGQDWMDICETAIKEAQRLGMKAYLYDENGFPSGSADGRAVENPQFRHVALALSDAKKIEGPTKVDLELRNLDGLVAVLAVPCEKGEINVAKTAVNLTEMVKDNRLAWDAPKGQWVLMTFARKLWRDNDMLDYMSSEGTAKFIELTHQRYQERFGEYFGNVVPGIFMDEPAVSYVEPGLPWTRKFTEEFTKDHGYDLISVLPVIFKDTGSNSWKSRCDFWDTVCRLYSENFFAQIQKYCRRHNIYSIGHVCHEGELFQQACRQVDFFRCGKYMDFGGTDQLLEMTWPSARGFEDGCSQNNHLALKFASSTAHLYDKPRVMSECFGVASQWGITLRTQKRLVDWHICLGVNLLMPHAFYYSIAGFRRWECPPCEFYQSSFWPYYGKLADYTGRLCSIFSEGEHAAKVAVLYPVKSMWTTDMSGSAPDERAKPIVAGMPKLTAALTRIHHDFDIIAEELITESEITNTIKVHSDEGKLLHEFEALVIPPCTTLGRKTLDCIEQFYNAGGMVILTGDAPDSSPENGADSYPAEVFSRIFGTDNFGSEPIHAKNENCGRAFRIPQVQLGSDFEKQLAQTLEPEVEPQAHIIVGDDSVGDILCYKYRKDGVDFYMLANTSVDQTFSVQIKLSSVGKPELWDAETGEVNDMDRYEIEADRILLELDFEPTQSHIISVRKDSGFKPVTTNPSPVESRVVMTVEDSWDFSTYRPNVLPLTDWKMKLWAESGYIFLRAVSDPNQTEGGRRYQSKFQVETDLKEAVLLFDGPVGYYCYDPANMKFTVNVELNDKLIENFVPGEYLDHVMKEARIGPLLQPGMNKLVVNTRIEQLDGGGLNNPPLLLGDFALEQRGESWVVVEPVKGKVKGSWTQFGYPFYSGVGTYQQNITVPKLRSDEKYFLVFEEVGDLAEVIINDRSAGVTAWEPFEVDITQYLKAGDNQLQIKVANSSQNLLALTPRPSGILGKVEIIARCR